MEPENTTSATPTIDKSSPVNQWLDIASRRLYSQFIALGELVTVAATTGGLKTVLELNMAAAHMADGGVVVFVNLDMPPLKIYARLFSILSGLPAKMAKDPLGFTQLQDLCHPLLKGFNFADRQGVPFNTEELIGIVLQTIQRTSASLIIVDGFDKVSAVSDARRIDVEKLLSSLSDIAANLNVCIVISSQVTREAEGLEALQLRHLAEASGKGDRSGLTIMLGQRIQNELVTLCLVKDRYCVRPEGKLVRLVLRDSLRMEILPTAGIAPDKYKIPPTPEYQRVKALPGDFSDDVADATMPDQDDADDYELSQPTGSRLLPLFHVSGDKFVMVERRLANSPMFQNYDYEGIFRLMDLAFLAQFEDGHRQYAPGTRIPVDLKRGQYKCAERELAERWGVPRSTVKSFLRTASEQGLLVVETVHTDGRWRNEFEPTNVPSKAPTPKALCTVITVKFYAAKLKKKEYEKDEKCANK